MAKATGSAKRQYKTDIHNLSQKDIDILVGETKNVMKKYKLEKQGVYDRRFALNKKIKEAGLTVDQIVNKANDATTAEAPKEQATTKRAYNKRAKKEDSPATSEEKKGDEMGLMVVNKQIPIIMKPIEINFENFSIKLNGVPKKISVNPDTNAIEIDL